MDDPLDSVDHLQPHFLLLWSWGDVAVEIYDLLVQAETQTEQKV